MTEEIAGQGSARALDPIERNSEILFGPFMVLTFTGTPSVASAGRDDVREMLVAAIGCNIAWGFVDGVMHVLHHLVVRGRQALLVEAVRGASRSDNAHRLIADEIGPVSAAIGTPELERMRQWIAALSVEALPKARVTRRDLRGAAGVLLLVFLSTFPVVLPFVFIADAGTARRVSAGVAIAMLFLCGHSWGRHAGLNPWRTGLAMVLLGLGIEAVVIALGG